MTAWHFGKIPTTSVRRRTSLFSQIAGYWNGFRPMLDGEGAEGQDVVGGVEDI